MTSPSDRAIAQAELLPCPFCGDTDVRISGTNTHAYAYCQGCSAEGPYNDYTPEDAIVSWNRRATAAPVVVGEVTDEMICRFANVYYGRGKTYGPDRIRAALSAALAGEE